MSILAFTPLALLIVLLWVLSRAQAYKEFPCFFIYTAFAVIADIARFVVRNHFNLYFNVYWTTEAGYAILGIVVLYEVFCAVFRNLTRIWWFRLIFPSAVVFATALTFTRAHQLPVQIANRLMAWIVLGELAVRFLQVSMFVLLVGLVALFGLRWRQYPFGISAGFGLYATIALLVTTKFSDLGTRYSFVWGVTLLVAYSISILIWLWFFRSPVRPEPRPPETFPLSLEDLGRYRDLMRRIRRQ